MKRIWPWLVILILCLACGCSYSRNATPLAAEYRRTTQTGTRKATLAIVLKQGHFTLNDSKQGLLWAGSYQVSADKITFTAADSGQVGLALCPGVEPYAYHWALNKAGTEITFTQLDDPCAFRSSEMTGETWQLHSDTPEAGE